MGNHSPRIAVRGFTVMELMLAMMAFMLLITIVLLGVAKQQAFRRDVTRSAAVSQLQKATAIYMSEHEVYPTFKGCITGQDDLTKELIADKYLEKDTGFKDPRWTDQIDKCIFYNGGGADYQIRFFMETDKVQSAGEHQVSP